MFIHPLLINQTLAMDMHCATSAARGCLYMEKVLRERNMYSSWHSQPQLLWVLAASSSPCTLLWNPTLGWQVLHGSSPELLEHLYTIPLTELLVRSGWGWNAFETIYLWLPSFLPPLFPVSMKGVFWEHTLSRSPWRLCCQRIQSKTKHDRILFKYKFW